MRNKMTSTKELIDEAISLPIEERTILIDSLLRSINPLSAENDRKWAEEAKRRLDEIKSGAVKPVGGKMSSVKSG
jgi:hypothetical protein